MKDWKEIWPDRVTPTGQPRRNLKTKEKTEVWVYRAKQVHGDLYDYSLVLFNKSTDKVTLVCKEHGTFTQVAYSHLAGHKCPKCSGTAKKSTSEFILQAKEVHCEKPYSYDKVVYTNNNTKVSIVCQYHGEFTQTPKDHLFGYGCPRCALENRPKADSMEFIDKCILVHGNLYSYQDTVYRGTHEKVTIICKEHGPFVQAAYSHLAGHRCPQCSGRGHNIVYLLSYGKGLYKLGITKDNMHTRLAALKRSFPQGYSAPVVIATKEIDQGARSVEQHLLNKYTNKPILDRKFDGYTELRILTEQEVEEICSFLETI